MGPVSIAVAVREDRHLVVTCRLAHSPEGHKFLTHRIRPRAQVGLESFLNFVPSSRASRTTWAARGR